MTVPETYEFGHLEPPAVQTWGYSNQGSVVHRLAGIRIYDTVRGKRTGTEYRWMCGNSVTTRSVTLLTKRPSGVRFCRRCPDISIPDGPVVYLALADGLVKVGQTGGIVNRMAVLHGELLRAIPGGRLMERYVLDQCPSPVRGREWFAMDDLPAIAAVFDAIAGEVAA